MISGCIEHTQKGQNGYGNKQYYDKQGRRRNTVLHRVVYCEANGLNPDDIKGKIVRHKCDNPRCINPEHLELGTQLDNVHDMITRGRAAFREKHPMRKLTFDQVNEIKRLYLAGGITQAQLGKLFKVSQSLINAILKEKLWLQS